MNQGENDHFVQGIAANQNGIHKRQDTSHVENGIADYYTQE